jgi:hypothetical protein
VTDICSPLLLGRRSGVCRLRSLLLGVVALERAVAGSTFRPVGAVRPAILATKPHHEFSLPRPGGSSEIAVYLDDDWTPWASTSERTGPGERRTYIARVDPDRVDACREALDREGLR